MEIGERCVYGIDFSGAKNAGEKIWVASGGLEGEALRIDTCRRADMLPGSSKRREQCLSALRTLVMGESNAAFGFDFPFGVPAPLVEEEGWESFALAFPYRYESADAFRQACREADGGNELKRVTDEESQAPFSPYNLRLYRQTYYGIRDLLSPLVRDESARILPMQEPLADSPWLLEVCPASTLKREWLYQPSYKGPEQRKHHAREHILETLEDRGMVIIPDRATRASLLEDRGGDALDSVIAAIATAEAIRNPDRLTSPASKEYEVEGYIYV